VCGHTNVIVDALSRLQFTPNPNLKENESIFLAEHFGAANKYLDVNIYPLTYTTLQRY
jgi:transcriptional antiterminator